MAPQGIQKVKLLQLNAWGGRLEYQIEGLIKEKRPDIVCLQEAISFSAKGSGLFVTIENIQKSYDLPYLAFDPVFSFNYMKGTARFGNCILSRSPIIRTESIFTHLEHKENFMYGEDSANVRNLIHAVVEAEDKKLCNVLTHHGYWVAEHKNGNAETKKQMEMILDFINELDGPVILTGDFNLVPESESIAIINASLKNLCKEYGLRTTRTNLTHKTEVCDYIFINKEVKEKTFYAEEKVASDHQALILEFDL